MDKNFNYIISIFFCAFIMVACGANEYPMYDTNERDAVYLDYTENTDSIYCNFGFRPTEYIDTVVRIKLMGMPKDIDRTIAISFDNEKYATEEFEAAAEEYYDIPSKVILKKNTTEAEIPVKLLRHEDIKTKKVILTVCLSQSDDFNVVGLKEFTICYDDKEPSKPRWWSKYRFGPYTVFKANLFFKYFRELEEEDKDIYDLIVSEYGEYLDEKGGVLSAYDITMTKYVHSKMYKYSQEHPELNLEISEPRL